MGVTVGAGPDREDGDPAALSPVRLRAVILHA